MGAGSEGRVGGEGRIEGLMNRVVWKEVSRQKKRNEVIICVCVLEATREDRHTQSTFYQPAAALTLLTRNEVSSNSGRELFWFLAEL